jgi:hypothetical protein
MKADLDVFAKKGYKGVYRTPKHDDGVDVVVINGSDGVLLQCKTISSDEASFGWEALKDVVAGEAAYRVRHPGVEFRKACIINHFFNGTAKMHAVLYDVELLDQSNVDGLLKDFPFVMHENESLLYTKWH